MEFYKLKQILGDNGINNIAAFDGVKGWLLLLLGVQGTSHLELISNNLSNTTAHLSPHHSLPHSPVTTGAVHIYSFTK